MILLFVLSFALCATRFCAALVKIGSCTYFIYLLHMQIVQNVCRLLPRHVLIEVLLPILGLAIMMAIVWVAELVCKKWLKWQLPLRLVGLK